MNLRRLYCLLLLTGVFIPFVASSLTEARVMTWNLLNYPDTDTALRNPHYRSVIHHIEPDILVVQEINGLNGVASFLSGVMNVSKPVYAAGTLIDGFDSDNAIFYKHTLFQFIGNAAIKTGARDINVFSLIHLPSGDTLLVYSVHLKSSTGVVNEQKRSEEVDSLRKHTNQLHPGTCFMVCGDFNIYHSGEDAYQKLITTTGENEGHVKDPLTLTGTWNNENYQVYHTQSTRLRSLGFGASGGLNDRFDMILVSEAIWQGGRIGYKKGSYLTFGNDGQHYNDSIHHAPNNAVGSIIANDLYYASDHLPVLVTLVFENTSATDNYHKSNLPVVFYHSVTNSIVVQLSDSAAEKIIITLTDGSGKKITELVGEQSLYRDGLFTLPVNEKLAEGIYFCSITVAGQITAQKVYIYH